jgi:aryl-alcohol dehydrogenase-like predicted oxidoreductase
MQTLASCHFLEPITAIQLEYSLVERNIEREHIPAAQEFGIAVCPWSPLAGGFLSGKYKKVKNGQGAQGRLDVVKNSGNPVFEKFTAKNWAILAALETVAQEVGKSPAQVALSWVVNQKGITSTLIGATKLSQLENNLQALEIVLSKEQMAKLDAASILETIHPYIFFGEEIQGMVNGGAIVNAWRKS